MGSRRSDLVRRLGSPGRAVEPDIELAPPAPDALPPHHLRRPIVEALLRREARPLRAAPPRSEPSPFRSALIDLCFERGFAALTVEELCRRAGVHRAAFRRRYADLEDCFYDVCRGELQRYRLRAADARAGLGDWRARLRATAYALYRFLAEDERRRRFAVVEARVAGGRSALLLAEEIAELFELIDEGRAEPTAPSTLTRATAESLGGGIFNAICVAAAHPGPMPPEAEVVPTLMYSAVLPYLGAASAATELEVPPPPRIAP